MGSGLAQLKEFQSEDKYVFHGSGLKLNLLEPRQAYNFVDQVQLEDGPPAVFASQAIEYAIFMALINRINCPDSISSSCSYENGEFKFGACEKTLEQLNSETRGFVHVLLKDHFTLRGENEWVCFKSIKPSAIIEIGLSDFSSEIAKIVPFK